MLIRRWISSRSLHLVLTSQHSKDRYWDQKSSIFFHLIHLTFFCENMPHSSLHEFNCPSSVIFCLKQAMQLFATFTEASVTCSASPIKHDGSSGFSHIQTPNCRDGQDAPWPSTSASPESLFPPSRWIIGTHSSPRAQEPSSLSTTA